MVEMASLWNLRSAMFYCVDWFFLESMMILLQRTIVGWIIPVQCEMQLEFGTMNLRKCSIPFFAALFPPFNVRKCSIILHKCSILYHFSQHDWYFSISVKFTKFTKCSIILCKCSIPYHFCSTISTFQYP